MSRRTLLTASVLAAVAASVSILLPSLLGLRIFHGTDLLERHAPWAETPPDRVTVSNPLLGDTVDVWMPMKANIAQRLQEGDLVPIWQPYVHGGDQIALLPNDGLLSPFNIPYWMVPISYAPGLVKAIEMAVSLGFMFLLLRRFGLGRHAAVIGGLIYTFSGFQVAWTNWAQAHIGALIPALFWAIDRALEERKPSTILPVAGVVAVMWFEGFPAVTGYALAFAALFALVRLSQLRGRRLWPAAGSVSAGVLLGTGLAAIQLVPFVHWVTSTADLAARGQHPGLTLARRTLATLALPNIFGSPTTGNYYGPANYLIYGPVNWVENQAFLGLAALVLVAAAAAFGSKVLAGPIRVYLWGSTALCIVLIYVGGPLLALAQGTPLFGISHVGRLRSVLLFLLAALAAVGFEAIFRDEPKSRRRLLLALAVVAAVVGSGVAKAAEMAQEAGQLSFLRGELLLGAAVLTATLGLVAATWRAKSKHWALALLPLVIAFECFRFAGSWWPQVEHEVFYPVTDAHLFLQKHLGSDRMVVTGLTMLPSTNVVYRLRSVTGHGFPDPRWADLLREVDPDAFRLSPTYSSIAHLEDLVNSPVLDRLGARFIVADPRHGVFGTTDNFGDEHAVDVEGLWQEEIRYESDIQAIVFEMAESYLPQNSSPTVVTSAVMSRDGTMLTTSQRRLVNPMSGRFEVAVVATDDDRADLIRVSVEGTQPLRLAANQSGSPIVGLVRAGQTTPRVGFAGGAIVYERPHALPRIRWASNALVIEDHHERISALSRGLPDDVVLLSRPTTPIADPSGDARIEILTNQEDLLEIRTQADGAGWLVVMDSMESSWRAWVGEDPAPLLEADHAGVAVPVPKGTHVVRLAPDPPGWRLGLAVTVASLTAAVAILALDRRRSRITTKDPT